MTAAEGETVRITYDSAAQVDAGDVLWSTTGRTYFVVHARKQERGKHRGRWHLRCVVGPAVKTILSPPGTRVHELHWHERKRRQGKNTP